MDEVGLLAEAIVHGALEVGTLLGELVRQPLLPRLVHQTRGLRFLVSDFGRFLQLVCVRFQDLGQLGFVFDFEFVSLLLDDIAVGVREVCEPGLQSVLSLDAFPSCEFTR